MGHDDDVLTTNVASLVHPARGQRAAIALLLVLRPFLTSCPFPIMATMAVAVVSPTPRSCMSRPARDVLALADAALYRAKAGGRDTYFLEAG